MSAVPIFTHFISKDMNLSITAFNGKFQVAVFDKASGNKGPSLALDFKDEDIVSYILLALDKVAAADSEVSIPITQMEYKPPQGYSVVGVMNFYRNSNNVFGLELTKGSTKYDIPFLAKKGIGLGGNIPDEPTRSKVALSTFRKRIELSIAALIKSKERDTNSPGGSPGGSPTSAPSTPPVGNITL